jgi:hypothetical protein
MGRKIPTISSFTTNEPVSSKESTIKIPDMASRIKRNNRLFSNKAPKTTRILPNKTIGKVFLTIRDSILKKEAEKGVQMPRNSSGPTYCVVVQIK